MKFNFWCIEFLKTYLRIQILNQKNEFRKRTEYS